jgi:dynein intermediate chain 3, axonemal
MKSTKQSTVYVDKPLSPHPWSSKSGFPDIEFEKNHVSREPYTIEITRPKRQLRQNIRLSDRRADAVGVAEFRSYKDPAFKQIKESDTGIQAAPRVIDACSQTPWYRAVNKAVQYSNSFDVSTESNHGLLSFLESATIKVEKALQQNETLDIYHETFRLGEDENLESNQTENELHEIKNFADPNYSKSKVLSCIDWMPKTHGILGVCAVRNIPHGTRLSTSGQINQSYILIWDFKQLVKPVVLLQCQEEVTVFRFNPNQPNIVVGGCATGQVVLWDISDVMINRSRRSNNRNSQSSDGNDREDEDSSNIPILPKFTSAIDHSHRKATNDLFWLPSSTQINYKGRLAGKEFLNSSSYQFVTVGGDGLVLVWDIRYEAIAADEVRHVARAKHVPTEKMQKDGSMKPLWAPVFRAQIKKLDGAGELSVCHASCILPIQKSISSNGNYLSSDIRSCLILTTEEGNIMAADLGAKKTETAIRDDDDDDGDMGRDFVKWSVADHPRPTVSLQQSPFYQDIFLSVGDWNFHIWKVGEDKPLYKSPICSTYLTVGAWSPTRPSVVVIATADGQLFGWDFTDSSYKPFMELKATHSRITSMEFLVGSSGSNRQQLLAVGDETGTLHVFETPRTLAKPIHKEDTVMKLFLDREYQVVAKISPVIHQSSSSFCLVAKSLLREQHSVVEISICKLGRAPRPDH